MFDNSEKSINQNSLTQTAIWQKLIAQQKQMQNFSMRLAFAQNDQRFKYFSLQEDGILFDFSKNLIDQTTFDLLIELANQAQIKQAISKLFNGYKVNHTENRMALHTALRTPSKHSIKANTLDITAQIDIALNQMDNLVNEVQGGRWLGFSGKKITDIVNIGIGGSFLGPKIINEALDPYINSELDCHFMTNIDGAEFTRLIKKIKPDTTLFIISSKSFTTLETIKNATAIKNWFISCGGNLQSIDKHFVAVTSNSKKAIEFGISPENILPIWDFVGGRFSLWSAVGLPVALMIGMENFRQLLAGAFSMDQHFQNKPLKQNIPVILALLGIWYSNFWQTQTHAICPYSYHLRNLHEYLQQLEMESSGKSVNIYGKSITYKTAPVIWGGAGCNGQHAYHQLLHQGTHLISIDFIAIKSSPYQVDDHNLWLYANCLAQSQTLMIGKSYAEIETEMIQAGFSQQEIANCAQHKVCSGNKPSNTLVLDELNPYNLGALIALYEHKVFVQSVIWQINAFDQFGVELGKVASFNIYQQLSNSNKSEQKVLNNVDDHNNSYKLNNLDSSTVGLANYFREVKDG